MRNYRTEGVVIKRRNVGEADRILTVFTKNEGKITIKAKGIRRIPSRRSAHVELLNLSQLTLYRGKKIGTLTEAQMINSYAAIKEDLARVGLAYHICELVDGLCPEGQENRQVFHLLTHTLDRLCGNEDIAVVIHEFEVTLLSLLGFWHKPYDESRTLDTHHFIENILERRLKSKKIFSKLV